MALQDLLDISSSKNKKIGFSEERIKKIVPVFRKYVAFWRKYPDIFVDTVLVGHNPRNFKFYTYQRIFLRSVMRHKYFYATFSRAFSKSFLSILCKLLQGILFPGSDLFISAAGKEQSGSILTEKVGLICELIPGIKNEINWTKGVTITNKDNVCYVFHNGSTLTVLTASERSRGQRKTAGILEECASMDGKILNEVLIPKFLGQGNVSYLENDVNDWKMVFAKAS